MKICLSRVSVLLLLVVTLLLAGCLDQVNRDNFAKIEQGMNRDQVLAILGEPDESKAVKLGMFNGETAIWNGRKYRIVVSFAQGGVVLTTIKEASESGEQ